MNRWPLAPIAMIGCLSSNAEQPGQAREVVILPLGDSITEGMPTTDGYRAKLKGELAARNIRVRFAGTLQSAAGRHEGWVGYTADQLLPRVNAALALQIPQVVLLHIGTNDIGLGQDGKSVAQEIDQLLQRIHQLAPDARVFVAQIIPMTLAGERFEREVRKLNAQLPDVAKRRRAAGQRVEVVNLHDAIDLSRDMFDALHPNANGHAKLGSSWVAPVVRALAR